MSAIAPLRIAAFDEEDLSVLSAHVQDAVVKVADINWSSAARRFILPMNRFAWETVCGRRRAGDQRRRAVLHFDRVTRFQSSGVSARERDAVLSVLAIVCRAAEAPEGTITIVCSGGAGLKLHVECIEARLTDLGAAWSASMRPQHAVGR